MARTSGKHQMQGVWGRAAPPMGSARGEAASQETTLQVRQEARGAEPPRKKPHSRCDGDREGRSRLASILISTLDEQLAPGEPPAK
jgi:hypothetical protein